MIKHQQPLLNQKLRRNRQLCALRLGDGLPEVVYSKHVNFATEPALFGLFASRHAAIDALHQLADMHRLCYGALALEKLKAGRACFRATICLCAGFCRGDESAQMHADRLLGGVEVTRVACWDYPWGHRRDRAARGAHPNSCDSNLVLLGQRQRFGTGQGA